MAATKGGTILIPRGTSIAAGGQYGGAVAISTDYGGSVGIQIANGATGPTAQAVAQVLTSKRAGVSVTGCTYASSVVTVNCNIPDAAVGDWVLFGAIGGITNVAGFFKLTAVSAGVSVQFTAYSAPSGTYTSGGSAIGGFWPVSQPLGGGTANNAVNGGAATTNPGIIPWELPVDPSFSAVGVAVAGNAGQAVTAWAEYGDVTGL